jgi:hypothetical protein
MSGAKILKAIQEAAAGDFARVTTHGQTWVRLDCVNTIDGYIRQIVRDEMIRSGVLVDRSNDT